MSAVQSPPAPQCHETVPPPPGAAVAILRPRIRLMGDDDLRPPRVASGQAGVWVGGPKLHGTPRKTGIGACHRNEHGSPAHLRAICCYSIRL
jgi:hypothetical protein